MLTWPCCFNVFLSPRLTLHNVFVQALELGLLNYKEVVMFAGLNAEVIAKEMRQL